eukprot:scaffold907_cov198-Chaetoceros_neogracile.AAC.5
MSEVQSPTHSFGLKQFLARIDFRHSKESNQCDSWCHLFTCPLFTRQLFKVVDCEVFNRRGWVLRHDDWLAIVYFEEDLCHSYAVVQYNLTI